MILSTPQQFFYPESPSYISHCDCDSKLLNNTIIACNLNKISKDTFRTFKLLVANYESPHNISFYLNSISAWAEVPPVAFNLHKVQRTRKCKCSNRFWYSDRWGDTCLVHICFPFRAFQGSILTGCSALFIHYTSLKPYLIRVFEQILT